MNVTCTTCQVPQPRKNYWRDVRRPAGLMSECKACSMQRNAAWKKDNLQAARRINQKCVRRIRTADPMTILLRSIKHRAAKRGIAFALTRADVVVPEFCPVLGIRMISAMGTGGGMTEGSPSIDRIDNNGGYTVDNIAVISWRANRLKNNATSDELRQIAEWMDSYAHPGGNLIGAPNTERQCVEGRAESVHDMPAMFASSEEKT